MSSSGGISERDIEERFIDKLLDLKYEFRKDIKELKRVGNQLS